MPSGSKTRVALGLVRARLTAVLNRSCGPTALTIGGLLLLGNSAYLAASTAPTLFHYANVAFHAAAGAIALVLLLVALRRYRAELGPGGLAAAIVLLAAAVAGAYLAWVGALRAHEVAKNVHAGLAAFGALAAGAWLGGGRARQLMRPAMHGLARAAFPIAVVAVAVPGLIRTTAGDRWLERYRIENPTTPPLAMDEEGGGRTSPFFPSSARTNVGGIISADFFQTSEACGRCHADIYKQWNSSAHHFSSFNNQWYRKSIEYMQDVVGTQPSKWCAGCHDHAVFFNGRFDRPIKEQIDTPEAQAGLGCTSCHAVTRVGSTMGQGDFTVEYPPLHGLAASTNPVLVASHDVLLHLDPAPHRETFLKPFHTDQTAEFCSSCHKVHLDQPVNAYRWFRGFNDYDNWQASGVSGEGARSFYYPPKPQNCRDCHMPWVASTDPAARDGRVRSHRFIAANTALPFVNGDSEQLRLTQEFLQDGQISVDVFGIARVDENLPSLPGFAGDRGPRLSSTFAVGEESGDRGGGAATIMPAAEVLAPLDKINATVRRGESVRVEVVVRTRKVGHFFPGGTVDAFDVWVEFEAVDEKGRVLLHSGAVSDGGRGPVDPGAHFYRSLQLDAHGNAINKRNAWATRSVAYVRLVGPGSADTIHYRLRIPDNAGERVRLRAKVNYRKFAWWNTQWAFAGVRDPADPTPPVAAAYDDGRWVFTGDTSKVSGGVKGIPNLPITVMARAEASIGVLSRQAQLPAVGPFLDPSARERWNDYGIGLLQQGDLKGAEAAFLRVVAIDPAYADGPLNVARVLVQEGDLPAAEALLRKSLAIDGSLARTHYFLGTALKGLGRYEEALQHLETAAAQYPRDRVVLNQIGRIQFLQQQFDKAIRSFERVLKIDPEDLQAHYNLMLCYQGIGSEALASREEKLYLRFKADESAQAIAGDFARRAPDDNNEAQSIHEHRR